MKLLIATGIYPPTVGGPATYSKLLNDELPKRGIDVRVVSFDTVRHLPSGVRHAAYMWKLAAHVRWADTIYAQDPVSVGYPAMLVAKLFRKPLMLKVVGDFAWEQGVQRFGVSDLLDAFVEGEKQYVSPVMRLKSVQTAVARYAARIIVPSQYLKGIVRAWGISADKIHVVYNAFESSVADVPSRDAAREARGITGPALLTAGRLVPWKGIETLIRVMPDVLKKVPDAVLYIAGSGPEQERLEAAITEHHLFDHVRLLGALPQSELFAYVRAADVFVLNTAYEGFSHQLLETLALGTPTITTTVGGNPELIRDGVNGLLVPFDDRDALVASITRMLGNSSFANQCANHGVETVRDFTTERLVQETIAVLTKPL